MNCMWLPDRSAYQHGSSVLMEPLSWRILALSPGAQISCHLDEARYSPTLCKFILLADKKQWDLWQYVGVFADVLPAGGAMRQAHLMQCSILYWCKIDLFSFLSQTSV